MADAKISALTALGAAPAVGDRIPIVDVSDTTQAASGTTKYVTVAQAFTNPAFTGTPTATTGYQVTATLGQGYGFVGDDNTLWGYRQADTLSAYAGGEKVRIDATQMSLFTANFAFTPNPGDGGSDIWSYQSEEKTLATGSTTSTTTANLAAANSVIRAILVRVQTTITTAANFNVRVTGGNPLAMIGTATTSLTNLTAGSTYVLVPAAFADQFNATATTLTITCNVNPGAGAVKLTPIYHRLVPPSG